MPEDVASVDLSDSVDLKIRKLSVSHTWVRFDPPSRHQQNKQFRLNWPLETGEAKIVRWLLVETAVHRVDQAQIEAFESPRAQMPVWKQLTFWDRAVRGEHNRLQRLTHQRAHDIANLLMVGVCSL